MPNITQKQEPFLMALLTKKIVDNKSEFIICHFNKFITHRNWWSQLCSGKSKPYTGIRTKWLERQLAKPNKMESMTCLLDLIFFFSRSANFYYTILQEIHRVISHRREKGKKGAKTHSQQASIHKEETLENLWRHSDLPLKMQRFPF